jgi:hypothetical protein
MASKNRVRNCGTRGTKIHHIYIEIYNFGYQFVTIITDCNLCIYFSLIENGIKMFRSSARKNK